MAGNVLPLKCIMCQILTLKQQKIPVEIIATAVVG
jgi:hypothetical protein